MRLTPLLITKTIIICNIFIFACVQGKKTSESADGETDSEDKNTIKFAVNHSKSTININNNNTNYTNDILNNNKLLSQPSPQLISRRYYKKCASINVRNDLKSFEQLRGCNIIDGSLTIALVSNKEHPYEQKDYENITFPELKEITEYLLFFRVQGLATLSKLFPNLAVIRGKELAFNSALIIRELMHLQKINLPKLSDILRGSVRIENNPNLCHVSTVNWEAICKHTFTPHVINHNNKRCNNRCPDHCRPWIARSNSDSTKLLLGDVKELGAENNRSLFCWSSSLCQDFCQPADGINLPTGPDGGCCSPQCAGGCYASDRADQCIACKAVSQRDTCVSHCDSNLFEYKGHCITEQACVETIERITNPRCHSDVQTITNFKAIRLPGDAHGRCQPHCPPNFEEDPTNKNKCKLCDNGKCRKICTNPQGDKPFMVTDVNSLQELSGCNVINGSLEISIKGGKNVLNELESAFQDLEEIRGFLKITRIHPILTLGFLRGLRAINGSELDRGQYSLTIIDNPNLQELFPFNKSDINPNQKPLTILNGKIFVHLNPKLCPSRISNLKMYASVAPWDESDVSPHTNGDKEACDLQKLRVLLDHGTATAVILKFENFVSRMDDPRSLLYYLVNYREAPHGNVTIFDGRDGCNSQNDLWVTTEETPITSKSAEYQEVIIKTKPATRYALYVKTFTILAGSTGAISDIIYFETAPDTPGIPRNLETSASSYDSVTVSWSPPSRSNGVIERYIVTIKREQESSDLGNIDTCDQIKYREKLTKSVTMEEPIIPALLSPSSNTVNDGSSAPAPTCKPASEKDLDLFADEVSFEDFLIDIVYLRQDCARISPKSRRKRSIDQDLSQPSRPVLRNEITSIKPSSVDKVDTIMRRRDGFNRLLFDKTKEKMDFNVTAGKVNPSSRFVTSISGLDHYTLYSIEIRACHGEFNGGKGSLLSKNYNNCSIEAISQVRTQPVEELDKVPMESIIFYPANETVSENIITWRKPERPNGKVVAYRVRYRPKNGKPDVWTEACLNTTMYNVYNGFVINNISPGTYLFSIQTISLYAGQILWTEPIEFFIEQDYLVSPPVLIFLIVFGLVVLILAVASGTYYYQKKQHELIYASVNPDYMQYEPDEWEIDQKRLIVADVIGSGSFGMVYKGQLITEGKSMDVAIKTVPKTSTAKQRMDFLREASIMKQFDTFHVVKLIGVVSVTTPVYVVMEYMQKGDLKDFLRGQRDVHKKENKPVVDGIYLMAAQIADGMAYLASKKFVHRDLAARNCMVNEDQVVKIGDFGLTRDVYANDYYRRDTQGRLPVRWMPPESLSDNLYTSASDVWAYGIVVWEIVTFSAYPYQGLSNEEVIKKVISGFTLPRPENCPNKLYDIMQKCWRRNDRDRPTFNDIVEYLLPETEDKLFPNCFYRRPHKNIDGDTIPQSTPEENNSGAESYPLLSWPSTRANGLSNGVKHVQQETDERHN